MVSQLQLTEPTYNEHGGSVRHLTVEHNGTMYKAAIFISAREAKENADIEVLLRSKVAQAHSDLQRKIRATQR